MTARGSAVASITVDMEACGHYSYSRAWLRHKSPRPDEEPVAIACDSLVADQSDPFIVLPFTRPVYRWLPAVKAISSPCSLPFVMGVEPSVPESV